ncbi:phage tail protein [uncultured Sphingomonas sp.]|uniref:phage tail protein n=1 Tax=uncultured Sphingomonas sp. TaxID=158754 RepID=UPI0035CAEBFD
MATLVLTTVGGLVGGPVGAALGSILGGAIDRRLLGPKRPEGPRLAELAVQTSSYGTRIPRLFGRMRVAGTVFWATDLIERRGRTGGGKGRAATTDYSYSANFAVLLSARPILDVGRIWADGKLLRGAGGDWKARTGFRLHLGSEDQAADPLIASAEGAQAPAARGCAYAVFEGLELADFGNRIPSLTFEVVADAGPVAIGAVARALGDEVDAEVAMTLEGFAATGGSVRAVLAELARAGGASVAARGSRVAVRDRPERVIELADAGVAAEGRAARRRRMLAPADTVARVVTVAHHDPARDWQIGVQRAARAGAGGRTEAVELPAALGADAAKTLAAALLARGEAGRTRRTLSLGPAGLEVRPGDGVRIGGEAGLWRVAATECERGAVSVELIAVEAETMPAAASAGRVLPAPDRVAGATVLHAFERPAEGARGAGPRLTMVAAGGAGWRSAALLYSLDDGASWTEAGGTAAPAVIGMVETPPVAAPATLIDRRSAVVVVLPEHMELRDADARAIDAGANLALLGDELVQFGRATPLGGGRWRLEELRRGRFATEGAAPAEVGARFALLEPEAARTVELPIGAIGREVRVLASGVGDRDGPVEARAVIGGRSVLPLAPVHLRAAISAEGGAWVTWVRRSQAGWSWVDGVDAPLGEEREALAVRVTRADGSVRVVATDAPGLMLEPGERAGGAVSVTVRQVGDLGIGAAAMLVVPGSGN